MDATFDQDNIFVAGRIEEMKAPLLNSHPMPSPNLAVGSPSNFCGINIASARPSVRAQSPQPRYDSMPRSSTTPRRPSACKPTFTNNNLSLDSLSLIDVRHSKTGRISDLDKDREDCSLIGDIIDKKMGVDQIIGVLKSASLQQFLLFMKSQSGVKFVQELMSTNATFRQEISELIIRNQLVNKLALNSVANFVVQKMVGVSKSIDKALCAQMAEDMFNLSMSKYGCRVVQTVFANVYPDLVKELIGTLKGRELSVCLNSSATHVIQVLLNRPHQVYEEFFYPLTAHGVLCVLVEDKLGCRVVMKCLDSLAKGITNDFVPPLLNSLIIPLLTDAGRYTENEFANYVIQNILKNKAFARQRDFIIDQVLLGNLLRLSQGKFSSHVVEAALDVVDKHRLARMCNEFFHDYKVGEKDRTPIEVLLFDQYGNYVVQKLLLIAITVSNGKRQGDLNWLSILSQAIIRNRDRLERYSSGKKILAIMAEKHPVVFGSPVGQH